MFVNETDEAVEFQQGILQRGGRQEKLVPVLKRLLQNVGDDVVRLVNIPQPVGLINHDQIPLRALHIRCLIPGELVGAEQNGVRLGLERPEVALPDRGVVGPGFEDLARQEELFAKLLMPLLPQVGGSDDQNAAFPLRPLLGNNQTCLNRFSQSYLIGEDRPTGQRRPKSEKRSIDLMRIEIHLSACYRPRQFFYAVRRATAGQLVGEVFGLVVGNGHGSGLKEW